MPGAEAPGTRPVGGRGNPEVFGLWTVGDLLLVIVCEELEDEAAFAARFPARNISLPAQSIRPSGPRSKSGSSSDLLTDWSVGGNGASSLG